MGLSNGDDEVGRRIRDLETTVYSQAGAIIAVDSGQARLVLARAPQAEGKVFVVPNSVDPDSLAELARADVKVPEGFPLVLVARRLVPKNGVEYAVRAAAIVRQKLPRIRFLLAGS